MDEISEAIKKKYIDDITSKYPLHRFFVAWIYLISIYSYNIKNGSFRIIDEISKIKISFLFDFSSGIFHELSVAHLFLSIFSTIISTFIYSKLKENAFLLLSKTSDFNGYTLKLSEKISSTRSPDQNINFFISKDISAELKGHREKLKSIHASGEALIALILALLYGLSSFIIIDYAILVIAIMIVIFIQIKSFGYYISKFIPYYVAERALLGAEVKFGEE